MKEGTPEQVEKKHKMNKMSLDIIEASKQFYNLMKKINKKLYFIVDINYQYLFTSSLQQEALCYCGDEGNNGLLPQVKTIFIPNKNISLNIKKTNNNEYVCIIECPQNSLHNVISGMSDAAYMLKMNQKWHIPLSATTLIPFTNKRIPWYKIKLFTNE